MSQPATHRSDRIHRMDRTHRGSADHWECLTLARPCCGGSSAFLPAVSRWCSECTWDAGVRSIRRAWCLPIPSRKRRRGRRAGRLTPVLLNHSSRAYTWGAAIAAYTGSRSTVSSCTWLQCSTTPGPEPGAGRRLHGSQRRVGTRVHRRPPRARRYPRLVQTRSPCTTPRRWPRIRRRGLPPICRRSRRCVRPPQQRDTRCSPPARFHEYPRFGFKRDFAELLRAEAKQLPRSAPGTCTASP